MCHWYRKADGSTSTKSTWADENVLCPLLTVTRPEILYHGKHEVTSGKEEEEEEKIKKKEEASILFNTTYRMLGRRMLLTPPSLTLILRQRLDSVCGVVLFTFLDCTHCVASPNMMSPTLFTSAGNRNHSHMVNRPSTQVKMSSSTSSSRGGGGGV